MLSELTPTNLDILNSLTECLFTVDKDFKISFMNTAAEKLTGFKLNEIKGKVCKRVFECDLCVKDCAIVEAFNFNAPVQDLRSVINSKSGKKISIKLNAAVLHDKNQNTIGGVVSFRKFDFNIDLEAPDNFYGIVGASKQIKDVFHLINEISDSSANVLIVGATGTGKELIANAIQATSSRKDQCFVKVNCSVIPPDLFASELFGHVKGAFTDANSDRVGRFELADKGTIFLDEIAEMPPFMQTQLLRVIQEGTFERVGESVSRKVDVRIIAATNLNFMDAIDKGKFREDLFYRLNVIPFEVPPLEKRLDDIPLLVHHFIQKFNPVYNKKINSVDEDALDILLQYNWPGNVRELENVIEYSFVRTKKDHSICRCSLPCYIKQNNGCDKSFNSKNRKLDANELLLLLRQNQWNKTKVAEILNINRTTLWRQLKTLGIE